MHKQVKIATQQLPISEWVEGVGGDTRAGVHARSVQDYILQHAVRPETLEKYLFYSKGNYTRNLIFKERCVRVHDHLLGDRAIQPHPQSSWQNCWMSAPIGRLRVQNFRVDERDAVCGTCHIVPTDTYDMGRGHPAYVNPLQPVHQVLNLRNSISGRSVSMCTRSRLIPARFTCRRRARIRTCRCITPASTGS